MRCGWVLVAAAAACGGHGVVAADGAAADARGADGAVGDATILCAETCAFPRLCPDPLPGTVSVCGRVFDLGTSLASDCLAAGPPVEVRAYGDNTTAALVRTQLDSCGRFALMNIPRDPSNVLEIATDDQTGSATDGYRLTIEPVVEPPAGGKVEQFVAFRTSVALDEMWTASSGSATSLGGQTFAEHGVLAMIFADTTHVRTFPLDGAPAAGVAVEGGGTDFYFNDEAALWRKTVSPAQSITGVNGTALVIDGPLLMYSGTSTGCMWPSRLTASPPPGIVAVEEFDGMCP
jgi:hypothetical protein